MSGDTELINILNNKLNLIKNSGTVSITTDDDGTDATGLNINKNLTVGGNFTVNGTTTTLSTTNSVIKDSLIELGNGTTEAPANDSGIVIERGTSANAFMGWDESADKFKVGTGTFTGSDSGDLAIDTGTLVANLEGNVTGNCSGTAATVTGTAQTAITSVGTLTALDVDNITIDGNTISSTDTDGNITLTPNGTGVVAIGAGNLSYGGTAVTATADELNIMDGSATTQATVTLEDGDGIVISDGDVMKQCLASDIKTYVSDLTLTTASQTSITSVGNLNGLTIASTQTINMGSNKITNVADPSSAQDSATKAYVDSVAQGLHVLEACRLATTGNITLSGTQDIDSVSTSVGNRILVKNQSTSSENGVYVVASGSWSRSTDFDSSDEVNPGDFTFVTEGTVNGGHGYVMTSTVSSLGSDSIVWSEFSGAENITAGNGLTKSGNTLSTDLKTNGGIVIESTELAVDLGASSITGTLSVNDGGTNATSFSDKAVIISQASGTDTLSSAVMDANGELLIGGTSGPTVATLTAGSNISISNEDGGITIESTDTNTTYTAGTGLSLSSTEFSINASQTTITGVGALTTGSIASGFGSISTGSAITTTGDITGGKVIADNITIDGNTISSTDTDGNITLTPNGTGVVAIGAGNLSYGGTAVTATADELNIMDGSATTQATVTLEDGDGIVISDGDVMKQCLASDIKTYVSDLTLTTASQTAITGVGALTTGSIASGFGSISTGSAITTTGDITGGKVIADNITIDGNTISSTAGTDLNITPLAGQQLVLDNTIVVDAGVISGATTITASGLITGGSFSATSDKNLKENIVKIEDALDTIMKIEGYGFNFKDSGNYSHGVIAQEVEEILPSLVTTNDSGVKSVDYLQLIPYLIESVKHLKSEIEELKSS